MFYTCQYQREGLVSGNLLFTWAVALQLAHRHHYSAKAPEEQLQLGHLPGQIEWE